MATERPALHKEIIFFCIRCGLPTQQNVRGFDGTKTTTQSLFKQNDQHPGFTWTTKILAR